MELTGKVINILGDSITEGAGASCVQNRFTDVLARTYGCTVNNYGVGGSRIARQRLITDDPGDRDYCMRVHEMDKNADMVVVFGGTNDYGHGDAPLGAPSDRTPETFHGACHYLMRTLLITYPGKPILICTPLRRTNENNLYGNGSGRKQSVTATLSDYRKIILETAFEYSLPVLDLYATSGIQPKIELIRERLLPDGLHPSDEGHAILARRIACALQQL